MTDERKTDPSELRSSAPPPQEDWRRVFDRGEALRGLAALLKYHEGEFRGQLADNLAELSKLQAERDQKRDDRISAIDTKLDTLIALVTTLAESIVEDHQKIVQLEVWRERWTRKHCDECIADREQEAQEG